MRATNFLILYSLCLCTINLFSMSQSDEDLQFIKQHGENTTRQLLKKIRQKQNVEDLLSQQIQNGKKIEQRKTFLEIISYKK